jgi:hypothetical protein
MTFEDFLKAVTDKVGPTGAFDIARDARLNALEAVIKAKSLATEEEINTAMEAEFQKIAETLRGLPNKPNG